jgi:esterase/lipase
MVSVGGVIRKVQKVGSKLLKKGRQIYYEKNPLAKTVKEGLDKTGVGKVIEKVEETADKLMEQITDELAGLVDNLDVIPKIIAKIKNKPELIKILFDIIRTYNNNVKPSNYINGKVILNNTEYLHALAAKNVYSFKNFEAFGDKWEMDKEHSIEGKWATYVSQKEPDRAILAYKGTAPTNISDLISDLFIALGETADSTRFQQALEAYKKVSSKYKKLSITGHSLAGTMSQYVARATGADAYSWNAGWGLDANLPKYLNKYKNIKIFKILSDPISLFTGFENISTMKVFDLPNKRGFSAHTVDNFLL